MKNKFILFLMFLIMFAIISGCTLAKESPEPSIEEEITIDDWREYLGEDFINGAFDEPIIWGCLVVIGDLNTGELYTPDDPDEEGALVIMVSNAYDNFYGEERNVNENVRSYGIGSLGAREYFNYVEINYSAVKEDFFGIEVFHMSEISFEINMYLLAGGDYDIQLLPLIYSDDNQLIIGEYGGVSLGIEGTEDGGGVSGTNRPVLTNSKKLGDYSAEIKCDIDFVLNCTIIDECTSIGILQFNSDNELINEDYYNNWTALDTATASGEYSHIYNALSECEYVVMEEAFSNSSRTYTRRTVISKDDYESDRVFYVSFPDENGLIPYDSFSIEFVDN